MARLDYRLENRTIVLVHTEVPPELANRGVGAKLVKAALEYARRVEPHGCSTLLVCCRLHSPNPQYQALVEPSGGMG